MTTYVVKDEHTLGYLIAGHPTMMDVLAGSVLKGGHDPKNGVVSTFGAAIRPATEADFKMFRCALPPNFVASIKG